MTNSSHQRGVSKLLLLLLVAGSSTSLFAQIRDDESSATYLAAQCAISSGGDASAYEVYCRRLAKTVALLSPGQQKRVFGFVPQPITFARPDEASQNGTGTGYGGAAPQDTFNPGGDGLNLTGIPGDPNADSGGDGVNVVPGSTDPVGNDPSSSEPDTVSKETEPDPEPQPNWWDEAWQWLEGVIDAIVEDLAERQEA
ncbi:MAG: hypothetical protein AAF733_11340 [Verrucomicrobiota bacterium]